MARVNTVTCTSCGRDYYIEKMLAKAMAANQKLKLRCPFCKQEFVPKADDAASTASANR
jgi:phage FluMu protein Com